MSDTRTVKVYEVLFSWNGCPWEGCGVDIIYNSLGLYGSRLLARQAIREDKRTRRKKGVEPGEYDEYHIEELDLIVHEVDNDKR